MNLPLLDDPLNRDADYGWFVEARFGLFLHFGLYSIASRHEWVMMREKITPNDYRQRYFGRFNPDRFDAHEWAARARAAGMRYAVLTTKHHDGFCLFDSQHTDFKSTNTPCGRDLVKEYVEALRAHGLRVGLYHSLIDWSHPEFPVDELHPLRDDEAARREPRDVTKYAAYLHGQVEELMTNYGTIDLLWFDFSYPNRALTWSKGKGREDWQSEKLVELIRKHQPTTIINNRLDIPGGMRTPEQFQSIAVDPAIERKRTFRLVEECHTMNGSWGYDRDNREFKTPEMLVQMLVNAISLGMNFLLNVGPDARGQFDPESAYRLEAIGDWMDQHAPSIRGAGRSFFDPPPGCRFTATKDRLYLHLFTWPYKEINLLGLSGKVVFARFLHDGSEVKVSDNSAGLAKALDLAEGETLDACRLALPVSAPDVLVPVIELELAEGTNPAGFS